MTYKPLLKTHLPINEEDYTMKHFLLGSLSGLVLGGIYGLVKTPRSGKENQEFLKDYIDETNHHVQDVTDKVNDLKHSIGTLTNEAKFVQNEFMADVQSTVSEFQYEAEPRLRRIQDKTEKIQSEVERTADTLSQSTK